MSDHPPPHDEQQMAADLDAALDALQRGQSIDRTMLLARHPGMASLLDALEQMFAPAKGGNGNVAPLARPGQIGPYTIERELGAGGFGVVYLAFDPAVKRRVAVKLLHPGRIDQPEALARFEREAQATGKLSHPGIVQLYDYSRQGPPWFLVTEYVEGVDPRQWCRKRQATPADIASLLATVADAVEYAHQHGVCHRDLKPGNILIDEQGQPHILDFGLARLEAGQGLDLTLPTTEGHILGSLAYMPPEQASGQSHTADARSDVYSMGVILYELLTGQLPFQGPAHTLPAQVLEATPPPPRQINPAVPLDLEAVCLKALARRPQDRYSSAAALADDLRRFVEGKEVVARREGMLGQIRRVLDRRHLETLRRGWVPLLLSLGVVILAGSVVVNTWELRLSSGNVWLPLVLTKGIQLAVMVALALWLWPAREGATRTALWRWLDLPATERQVIMLVPGYYGSYLILILINQFREVPIPAPPVLALLAGMGFLNLGATIWGWFYVWGIGFLLLAVLTVLAAPYGSTLLGMGWFVCLVVASFHLHWSR